MKREANATVGILCLRFSSKNQSTNTHGKCIMQTFSYQSLGFALCQSAKNFQGRSNAPPF